MESFIAKLKDNAVKLPNEIAISYGEQELTYSELDNITDMISYNLGAVIKYRRQMPIVIYMERSMEFILAIISILKCGCYYIPIEKPIPEERVKYIINDVSAKVVITEKLSDFGVDVKSVSIEQLKSISESIVHNVDIETEDEDIVYCIYTSGTSGVPKGVLIMHKNLYNLIDSFYEIVYGRLKYEDKIAVVASFSFDASVKQIFCALYYGHSLVIVPSKIKYFGRKFNHFLKEQKITLCDMTPSLLDLMISQRIDELYAVPYILVGGEILETELVIRYYSMYSNQRTTVINVYGPTECCVDVSYYYVHINKDAKSYKSVPIGSTLKNTYIDIMDENGEKISSDGILGEIYVSGAQVGAGYINNYNTSFGVDKITGLPYYKTGDLAFYEKKDIYIVGRKDSQIKINGYRVDLGEIRERINYYKKGKYLVQLYKNGCFNRIVVFYENTGEYTLDIRTLKEYLSKYLPIYMVPDIYIGIERIPLSANGKVEYKELYNLYEQYLRQN